MGKLELLLGVLQRRKPGMHDATSSFQASIPSSVQERGVFSDGTGVDGSTAANKRDSEGQTPATGSIQWWFARQAQHGTTGAGFEQPAQSGHADREPTRSRLEGVGSLEHAHHDFAERNSFGCGANASNGRLERTNSREGASSVRPAQMDSGRSNGAMADCCRDQKKSVADSQRFHESMSKLEEMEGSVQLAMARETQDDRVLVRIRPHLSKQQEWNEAICIVKSIVLEGGWRNQEWSCSSGPCCEAAEHPTL